MTARLLRRQLPPVRPRAACSGAEARLLGLCALVLPPPHAASWSASPTQQPVSSRAPPLPCRARGVDPVTKLTVCQGPPEPVSLHCPYLARASHSQATPSRRATATTVPRRQPTAQIPTPSCQPSARAGDRARCSSGRPPTAAGAVGSSGCASRAAATQLAACSRQALYMTVAS